MRACSLVLSGILAMMYAVSTQASCIYPAEPPPPPDGATATMEMMLEARRAILEFDADIRAFNECLQSEIDRIERDSRIEWQDLEALQAQHAELHNGALDHLEEVAAKFNEQLRIFRARDAN